MATNEPPDTGPTGSTSPIPPPRGPSATLRLGEQPGDWVGPYKLLEVIGEGGFGTVWLAEQAGPVRRRVALKVIKPGMDSKAVIARFEAERQALAMMSHPNVAKVLDVGATAQGLPYFVMEHVKGAPITDYCDKHRLTIEQRLKLFVVVCDAVQHAHMKGIIHRDLKPSNILVTIAESGGAGARPVVIDFGVAKALAGRLTEQTIFTERGELIGTPEYMSPEQAEMSETDIDTRSDVYSLGVVLYELLTGAVPFDTKTLRAAGQGAIQKLIREQDPPRPSTRLSTMGESSTAVASARQTGLDALESLLRRELEWIPLKALRKDRAERYRSASELADDVGNYLDHRPLIAAPESTGYKVRKFVRRNKGTVAAAGVIAASLLLATGVSVWFGFSEAEQRAIAQTRRQQAELSEAEARRQTMITMESVQFLKQIFARAHAEGTTEKPLSVQDAVDIAVRYNELTRWSDPLVEASVRTTFAGVLDSVGDSLGAEKQATIARAIFDGRDSKGTEYAEVLAVLASAAILHENYKLAIELYTQAIGVLEPLATGTPTDLVAANAWAAARCNLAYAMYCNTDLGVNTATIQAREQALVHLRKTIDLSRELAVPTDTLAEISATLGQLLTDNKRDGEAEAILRQAVADLDRDKPWHPLGAAARRSLAELAARRGAVDEADELYTKALEIQRRSLRAMSPDLAETLVRYGTLHLSLKRGPEARAAFDEAATIQEAAGLTFYAATSLLGASEGCVLIGDLDAAVARLRRADVELLRNTPITNEARSLIQVRRASFLITLSKFGEAETILLGLVPSGTRAEEVRERLVRLYEAWERSEPGKGYDRKAEEYRTSSERK